MNYKMARAGSGGKTHLVHTGTNVSGIDFAIILCGSQQFNGSGNGQLNRLQDLDLTKITCKRCLKRHSK
jgi:hypothetical protein